MRRPPPVRVGIYRVYCGGVGYIPGTYCIMQIRERYVVGVMSKLCSLECYIYIPVYGMYRYVPPVCTLPVMGHNPKNPWGSKPRPKGPCTATQINCGPLHVAFQASWAHCLPLAPPQTAWVAQPSVWGMCRVVGPPRQHLVYCFGGWYIPGIYRYIPLPVCTTPMYPPTLNTVSI